MIDPVKPLTRKERARRTRSRIIDAATNLFASRGYAGTTMDAVAREAGVAIQTVYLVFHTKPELLIDTVVEQAWGPDPRSPAARAWLQDLETASDGARRLAIAVDAGVEIYRRAASLFPSLIAAASMDADVRTAWQRIIGERHAAMDRIVTLMHDRGELRDGVTAAHAADILIALHRHELYLACVHERGWSAETFKAWLYRTLCEQLLPGSVASAAVMPESSAAVGTTFEEALRMLP